MSWLAERQGYVDRVPDWMNYDNMTSIPVVTISGERQTGKSHMMLDRMASLAYEGMKVLFLGPTLRYARHQFLDLESRELPGIARVLPTAPYIVDFHGGGQIMFGSPLMRRRIGDGADVLVLDDVDTYVPFYLFPSLKLVYNIHTIH